MQKIKILHIIKSLGRGGAETLLPETLRLHNKELFEFHYIYFLPWKNQMVEAIENQGGQVTCISASNNLNLIQQYPKVIEYCKKNNIDVIHCHLPWSGFLSRIVNFRSNIPVIYTEHNIQEKYHFATKLLNKLSFNYQSLALGVSNDVTKSIIDNIHPKVKVQTLLNGVNTKRFFKDKLKRKAIRDLYNIPSNAIVIGNIAVFRKQKAILDWVKVFKLINNKFPEVYGLLVGAGPEEDEIKSLIKELNLSDRIITPGLQTDTVAYFSAMDIFFMSSQFEGLPIALLEAMSTECAVVSTKAGGVVEAIRHNKDGLLSEVGDIDDLSSNITEVINNSLKLKCFQKAARSRVEESFSLESMVNNLEKIYQNEYIS